MILIYYLASIFDCFCALPMMGLINHTRAQGKPTDTAAASPLFSTLQSYWLPLLRQDFAHRDSKDK